MKGLAVHAILALGLASQAAHAVTAGDGDVLLGFRATGGTGSSTNLVVNIGQASQFTGATGATTVTSLNADLTAIYGASWATRTDLVWGVIGGTGHTDISVSDPAFTIYASRAEATLGTAATAWTRKGTTGQTSTTSQVDTEKGTLINGTAATAANAITQSASSSPSWTSQQTLGGISFGAYNPTIEGTPAQALDFFRMAPSSILTPGDLLGTFVLGAHGNVSFVPQSGGAPASSLTNSSSVISVTDAAANSGATSVTVNLTRTGGLEAASVSFSTVAGTGANGATSPANFTAISGQTVNFDEGQASASVTITLSGTVFANAKKFSVVISSPTGATLGTATANVHMKGSVTDVTAPVITITKPAANSSVKAATAGITVAGVLGTGTGTADATIDTINVSVNGGAAQAAAITTQKSWTVTTTVGVVPGANTAVVTATDTSGNATTATVHFTYLVSSPLVLASNPSTSAGTITISPTLASGSGIIGQVYTVTAKPVAGFFFSSWSGTGGTTFASASSITTTFTFAAGNTVTANFSASPFTDGTSGTPVVAGTYNGVVQGSTSTTDTQANAGIFTAAVVKNTGAFSGKLILDGVTAPIAGVFNNVSLAFNSPALANGFNYSLLLDTTHSKITGTITEKRAGTTVAVINVSSKQAYSKTNIGTAGAQATTYNVAFTAPATPASLALGEYPEGNGYGILTVSTVDGTSKLVGVLADGTAYTSAAILCIDGTVPVYASFAVRSGSIVGTATIDQTQPTTDVTATGIRWFRSATSSQYYPFGYAFGSDTGLTVNAVGAKQSTSTAPTLSSTASVTLSGDAISLSGKVIGSAGASTDKTTKLAFKATTNVIAGTYTPVGGAAYILGGIVVGKASSTCYGYVLTPAVKNTDGSGEGGLLTVTP